MPGLTISKITKGKIKDFAERNLYKALASTVALDEEVRNVRTIHQSKGTESESVLVYLEDSEQLQHVLAPVNASNAEEKRITYVGLSRARDRLFLCTPPTVKIDGAP